MSDTTLTTVADLFDGPITGEEGRTFIEELIATAPTPISLEVLRTPGTPESAIIYALGEAEAARSADRILFAKSSFRSTASRPWLAVIAEQQFGLPVRGADFATTNLTVTNSGGGNYGPFAPRTFRVRASATQKIYVNTAEVTIGSSSTQSVGIIAEDLGTGSNALPGEIDELEAPLEGVTVTNAQAAIGQDEETSESINTRIEARIGAFGVDGATGFSTGATSSAFESIALNGPDNGGGVPREDGSRITVTRTKLVKDLVTLDLTLYVADDDGPLAPSDVDLIEDAVVTYAEWLGSTVIVANTVAVFLTVDGAMTIRGTPTDAALDDAIDAELVLATRGAPIGGFPPSNGIPLRYVENAVESAGDAGKATAFKLVDIVLTDPTAGTALAENEVIVISRGTITYTRV